MPKPSSSGASATVDRQYDVLVVGGGLIGASIAQGLSGGGLRVGVVERESFPDRGADAALDPVPDPFGRRGIALSLASRLILEGLPEGSALWQRLAAGASAIRAVQVSERGGFGVTHFEAAALGVPALGYVVLADTAARAVRAVLGANASVDVLSPFSLGTLKIQADRVQATLIPGSAERGAGGHQTPGSEERLQSPGTSRDSLQGALQVSARLLVAADGGHSQVRDLCGIGVHRRDFRQQVVIGTVATTRANQGVAYERFTPQGPLALLPIGTHHSALIWTVPAGNGELLLAAPKRNFCAQVQAAFGPRLGRIDGVGQRACFPVERISAARSTGYRVALVGNAAHQLHPVAGQGFNLGLRDVKRLVGFLGPAREDPGSSSVLRAFAAAGARDRRSTRRFTESLLTAFGSRSGPLRVGRNLAMLGLDAVTPLRQGFAWQAMGFADRVECDAALAAYRRECG